MIFVVDDNSKRRPDLPITEPRLGHLHHLPFWTKMKLLENSEKGMTLGSMEVSKVMGGTPKSSKSLDLVDHDLILKPMVT